MGINIVVNGYYRSGTTFIWNYLKEELVRRGYFCFYEPLNPGLANLILKEQKEKKINKLHGSFLFEDYLKLNEEILYNIFINNPHYNNGFYPRNYLEVEYYLNLFDKIEKEVFLQVNRLHFYLDIIFKKFTKNVIHIIRNPLDVWISIKKAFEVRDFDTILRKILIKITKPYRLQYAFNIKNDFNWIYEKLGYPVNYDSFYIKRLLGNFSAFEMFIVVWIITNYYAIKSIVKNNGLILVYEKIVDNPEYLKNSLENFFKFKFEKDPNVKKGNYNKFNNRLLKRLEKIIDRYKLNYEYQFITNYL